MENYDQDHYDEIDGREEMTDDLVDGIEDEVSRTYSEDFSADYRTLEDY